METGSDDNKFFKIAVFLGDRCVAEGEGHSKIEAEKEAARAALQKEYQVSLA